MSKVKTKCNICPTIKSEERMKFYSARPDKDLDEEFEFLEAKLQEVSMVFKKVKRIYAFNVMINFCFLRFY
jgi:hypothetical protein